MNLHEQPVRMHGCHELPVRVGTSCVGTPTHSARHTPPPPLLNPRWSTRTQIREENPRLARDSRVLRVTMDNVYEVFTTPRDQTGLKVRSAPAAPG